MAIEVVAGVAVIVACVVLLGRRRPGDATSVRGYRDTLSTLEQLQGQPRQERAPRTGSRPQAGSRTDMGRYSGLEALGRASTGPPARSGRQSRRLMATLDREPRRLGAPILAVAILAAVVGAVLYVGLRAHHPRSGPAGSATASHHHGPTGTTSTTSTTLPARYTASNATTSSATYAPATTSYTLSLGATTGACWMDVTNAKGTTVLAQAITPGTTRPLTLSGQATVVIGAPSVAVLKIDGVPAGLPSGAQSPFTVTLTPAG